MNLNQTRETPNYNRTMRLLPDKMQTAIIKKDIMGITFNKRIVLSLIILPLVMTVVVPLSFLLPILFSPSDSQDLAELTQLLGYSGPDEGGNMQQPLIYLMVNNLLPVFFILIPIMSSSVMAASSFVGEKEKNTLETLLYCPLPLKDIFSAKVLASFLLGMVISVLSFVIMLAVIEPLLFFRTGTIIILNTNWIIIMFLVSPAASLISISLIVRGSAKAKSSEESTMTSMFLIMPVILLVIGQSSGVMILDAKIFFILGAVMAIIAVFMFRNLLSKFKYETLLQ